MVITNTYIIYTYTSYIYIYVYSTHLYSLYVCIVCLKERLTNVKGGTATTVEFALNLTAAVSLAVCLVFLFFIFALIIIKYVLQKRSSDFLLTNLVNTRVFFCFCFHLCVCVYRSITARRNCLCSIYRLLCAALYFKVLPTFVKVLFMFSFFSFLFLAISSFCTSALSYISLSLSLPRRLRCSLFARRRRRRCRCCAQC